MHCIISLELPFIKWWMVIIFCLFSKHRLCLSRNKNNVYSGKTYFSLFKVLFWGCSLHGLVYVIRNIMISAERTTFFSLEYFSPKAELHFFLKENIYCRARERGCNFCCNRFFTRNMWMSRMTIIIIIFFFFNILSVW